MELGLFGGYISASRKIFREGLAMDRDMAIGMAKSFLGACTGEFEEQTLLENLREEYLDYCTVAA